MSERRKASFYFNHYGTWDYESIQVRSRVLVDTNSCSFVFGPSFPCPLCCSSVDCQKLNLSLSHNMGLFQNDSPHFSPSSPPWDSQISALFGPVFSLLHPAVLEFRVCWLIQHVLLHFFSLALCLSLLSALSSGSCFHTSLLLSSGMAMCDMHTCC